MLPIFRQITNNLGTFKKKNTDFWVPLRTSKSVSWGEGLGKGMISRHLYLSPLGDSENEAVWDLCVISTPLISQIGKPITKGTTGFCVKGWHFIVSRIRTQGFRPTCSPQDTTCQTWSIPKTLRCCFLLGTKLSSSWSMWFLWSAQFIFSPSSNRGGQELQMWVAHKKSLGSPTEFKILILVFKLQLYLQCRKLEP